MPKKYETVTTTKSGDCLRKEVTTPLTAKTAKEDTSTATQEIPITVQQLASAIALNCSLESSEIEPIKESHSSGTISGNKTPESEEPTPRQVKQ